MKQPPFESVVDAVPLDPLGGVELGHEDLLVFFYCWWGGYTPKMDLEPARTSLNTDNPAVDYWKEDLRRFGRLWLSLERPDLYKLWRDSGGGWVRWVAFTHPETGACHRLFLPAFWRGCPKDDQRIVRYLFHAALD